MSVCWVIDPLPIKARGEDDKLLVKRWADKFGVERAKGKHHRVLLRKIT
jgi:hypothetical protein